MEDTGSLILSSDSDKPKSKIKTPNSTRRSRGYSYEDKLVEWFNGRLYDNTSEEYGSNEYFYAVRLGGTTETMPDVAITISRHSGEGKAITIEAKAHSGNRIYIPEDQVKRCLDFLITFLLQFDDRYVVLAYKFNRNKNKLTARKNAIFRYVCFDECKRLRQVLENKEIKTWGYNIKKDEPIFINAEGFKEVELPFYHVFNTLEDLELWVKYGFISREVIED